MSTSQDHAPLTRGGRFALYGLMGWALEVVFTAAVDSCQRRADSRLRGHSYVWMHPIYGAGGLLCEQLGRALARRGAPWWQRGLAYAGACFAVEYTSGWALRRAVGACPWDYGAARANVHGLIRLDYAPLWAACGLAAEPLARVIERVRLTPSLGDGERPRLA